MKILDNRLRMMDSSVNNLRSKIKNSKRGFTLVEILIYMGILGFIIVILTQILTSVLSARLESVAHSSVQQDGNYILSRFYYDMTRAESIDFPANPGNSGNTLTITINGDQYTYALSNGKLILTNSLGVNDLNSYDTTISNLSFLRLGNVGGNNTITITFTLTGNTIKEGGRLETRNFQTSSGIR